MSKSRSGRQILLDEFESILRHLIIFGEEESEGFSEVMELFEGLTGCRNLNARNNIPKSDGIIKIMMDLPDHEFKVLARMDKASFHEMVRLIENHPIFQNYSNHKQAPVWIQLMVVLNRLGCDGNGVSIDRTSIFAGKKQFILF